MELRYVVESQTLNPSSCGSFIQGGYSEIGMASFNKSKYGYADIKVQLTVSYNNSNYEGTGGWAVWPIKEIIYSSK